MKEKLAAAKRKTGRRVYFSTAGLALVLTYDKLADGANTISVINHPRHINGRHLNGIRRAGADEADEVLAAQYFFV
jgi:hypothetical protein